MGPSVLLQTLHEFLHLHALANTIWHPVLNLLHLENVFALFQTQTKCLLFHKSFSDMLSRTHLLSTIL